MMIIGPFPSGLAANVHSEERKAFELLSAKQDVASFGLPLTWYRLRLSAMRASASLWCGDGSFRIFGGSFFLYNLCFVCFYIDLLYSTFRLCITSSTLLLVWSCGCINVYERAYMCMCVCKRVRVCVSVMYIHTVYETLLLAAPSILLSPPPPHSQSLFIPR